MFALADSIPSASSSPTPWHRPLRPLVTRAAGLMKVAAIAGGAMAAVGAGELDAATYNLILDPVVSGIPPYQLYPGARGTFEIPDALLGPANAGKLIPLSRFTRFDITVARHRFNLPGDLVLTTNSGLLLDANGQPLVFGSKRDPIAPEAIILDQDPDPPYPRSYAKLQFTNITSGTGRAWDYLDPTLRGPYASLKDGRYRIDGAPPIKPAVPNIVVITHGLAPGGDHDHPGYLHHIAEAIQARLKSEGLVTADTYIMEYEWPEAVVTPVSFLQLILTYKTEYTAAFNATASAGGRLATKLWKIINDGEKATGKRYDPKIHLIGHSLGSMVNAHAVKILNTMSKSTTIEQVTILDDPLGVGYNDPLGSEIDPKKGKNRPIYPEMPKFFYDTMSTSKLLYVENFYATASPRFGGPLPGAGPADIISSKAIYQGVRLPDINHTTVHTKFYASLIRGKVKVGSRYLEWVSPILPGWKPAKSWDADVGKAQPPVIVD